MNFIKIFETIRNNNFFEGFVVSIILISALSIGFSTFDESIDPKYLQ